MPAHRSSLTLKLLLGVIVAIVAIVVIIQLLPPRELGEGALRSEAGGDNDVAPGEADESEMTVPPVEAVPPQQLSELGAEWETDSSGIVTADLSEVEMRDELAESLSEIETLTKLVLRKSSMTEAGWERLSQLDRVQQLDLRGCPIDNTGFRAIVSGMPRLRAVRLSGQNGQTTVDDDGMSALADCSELKALAVDHLWVSGIGIEAIQPCENLAELYLANTLVDDGALQTLARFPKLQKLRLAKTSVGTAGIEYLTDLELVDLDISECSQVLDASMEPLGTIRSLERLNLWRDSISDSGLAKLAELSRLKWLNLDNTHVSDAGLKHLAGMGQLEFLHLGSTAVSDEGLPALFGLETLKDLKVTRTAVSAEGVQAIKEAIPGIDVQLKYVEGE